ncbi:hypothetical protein K3495_g11415 [Podosphaera aphanis]|nr:hypothetical protein K3495_g11415 [Podosphaera aphanis]
MVDTGCLCLSVIDESLVRNHKLYTKSIRPRRLKLAEESKELKITQITHFKMDIDGRQEQIWGYVMLNLAYPIILGKPWMERNKVVYAAEDHSLLIEHGGQKLLVRASGWCDKILSNEGKQGIARVRLAEESRISYSKLKEVCDQVRKKKSSPIEQVLGAI